MILSNMLHNLITVKFQTLFRRLVPYHCLTMRSRKTGDRCGETYQDTVRQFNAVVKKVISTVLIGGTEVKVSQRAEILTKWIEIADVR